MGAARHRRAARDRQPERHVLAHMAASVPGVVKAKLLDGTLAYWNDSAERLFGYTAAEAVGRSVAMLFPPDRQDEMIGILDRVARGEAVGPYITERVRKDGRTVPVSVQVTPLRDDAGSVVGAATIARLVVAANERYRELVEAAPDGMLAVDAAGWIVLVNAQAERLFGYARSELVGQPVELLVPDVARAAHGAHRAAYAAAPRTRPMGAGLLLRGRRKDGTSFPIEISLSPLDGSDGPLTVAAVRDATERQAAEEQARQLAAERAARASAQEQAAIHVQLNAELRALAEAERAARAEAQRQAEHTTRLLALTAALAGATTAADVAAVVLGQGVAALGGSAGLVALVVDGAELELIGAQGYPAELVTPWRRFPIAADVPLADAVRSGEPVLLGSPQERAVRYPALSPELPALGFHAWAVYPLALDGRVLGGLGFNWPTARSFDDDDRAFMLALAQQCAQALERARLLDAEHVARAAAEATAIDNARLYAEAQAAVRARDEFVAVVAHDLRNPLGSLRAYAHIALHELAAPAPRLDRVRTAVARVDEQTERMTRLIERLLDLTRLEGGKVALERADADVAALVEGIGAAFRAAHPDRVIAVQVLDSVRAPVDAVRIEQVVTNLLDNALRYAPPDSPIEVEVGAPDSSTVRIAVRDHGPGIPADRRGRLFERFYQAHTDGSSAVGLGLGLYICRHLVELHGGTIVAEVPDDGGSRFVLLLPRTSSLRRSEPT